MTAKEYLSRLRNLDIMIQQKQAEVDDLKLIATATGGFSSDEIVKSSKRGDTLERKVLKYVDLEQEINSDIDNLVHMRHVLIDEIHQLTDSRFIELLFKRYVEYKKFEKISVEMDYEYDWCRKLHLEALDEFQRSILDKKVIQHTQTHIPM